MKKILIYNQKGGVGKTTLSHHIGAMLARQGKTTILADFDSQCNLTGVTLGLDIAGEGYNDEELIKIENKFDELYKTNLKNPKNIYDALSPVFNNRPIPMVACECQKLKDRLYLMPGHIKISEFEVALNIAHSFTTMSIYQNIPGAINQSIELTSQKYDADYVIIDVSPSISAINQNLFGICDYIIIPAAPDFYSRMAINSLSETLVKWNKWYKQISESDFIQNSEYPLPLQIPKFLGILLNNYKASNINQDGSVQPMTKGFQIMKDRLFEVVIKKMIPELGDQDLLLEKSYYSEKYILGEIKNYQSVITASHEQNVPVFDLDLRKILNKNNSYDSNISDSRSIFEKIINKIIKADEYVK